MNRYIRFLAASAFLVLTAIPHLCANITLPAQDSELKPDKRLGAIAFLTASLLSSNHYSKQRMDDIVSKKFFNEYMKTLDPNKMFFLENEVDSYRNKYELTLDNMLMSPGGSDLTFAFSAYNKLNVRMHEYYNYAVEISKQKIDFNSEETFLIDRKDVPWPKNEAEMKEIWRKRTLNEMLAAKLMQRAIDEQNAKKKADTKSDTAPAVEHTSWKQGSDAERLQKRLKQLCTFFDGRTPLDVLEMYLSALARVYDPHSGYMAPKTEEQFNIAMGLQLIGIGAELTVDDGYVKINRLIPGGPADKSKLLKVNDRIIAVGEGDSEPVDIIDVPLDKAVNFIRGKEKTTVALTILDGAAGLGAPPKIIRLVREKVELKDAEAKCDTRMVKDTDGKELKIGIIHLPSFYRNFTGGGIEKNAFDDVKKLVEKLKQDKVDGIILDVRSNGGGALLDAIQISGLFIKEGTVVQIRGTNGNVERCLDPDPSIEYNGPLILMQNKFSASASEILAAAMQDYQRAIIVGDAQSHGKGTVQEVRDMNRFAPAFNITPPLGSIKFTQAKFYRANGESTQIQGVVPDIVFPSFSVHIESGEGSLEHALPFDTIVAAPLESYIPDYTNTVKNLREKSEERIKKSEKFKILSEQIDFVGEQRKNKELSLNEEKRWALYQREKEIGDRQAELMRIENESTAPDTAVSKSNDIYLDETLLIMRDLCDVIKTKEAKK